jgi:2-polyprenyl-3-methyl-5-hydroxy-6-metoxy-1,4-benzoquinol methylase
MNPRPKEDWINSYYENSPVYDLNREENVWFGSPQERSLQLKYPESFNRYNKAILEEIETYVRPGRMLDIGCSIGTLLRLARERGWKVSGLELAEDIAGFAHAEYDLEVYTSDLRQLSLERDSYDCITMIHVLEHLADLGSYLTEIYRLLRQGGILYIRTPNWHSFKYKLAGQYYFLHVPEHLTWFSLSSLTYLLEKHKFKIIEKTVSCFSNDPYFYFGIIKRLKLDSLIFKILGYDNKQWKEEDKINIQNNHTDAKRTSTTYGCIDKITKFFNFFWPNKIISFSGMGDELIAIAQKNTDD